MVQANFLREPQFSLRTQWERIFSLFSFRAFCSTWQGLSALPHTRVWQSSGWPCQQLQGCLALSDESVGNLVQYCIGFNLVQYCIGFNLVQYCTGFNLVQYCTGFDLVQYCFVLILKFFHTIILLPIKFSIATSKRCNCNQRKEIWLKCHTRCRPLGPDTEWSPSRHSHCPRKSYQNSYE